MAASSLLDGCRFTPTLGGTTDWTYSSFVTGYQSPAAANVVNGAQYSYRAESADLSQWEFGTGTYNTSTGVLARTTILYSFTGGAFGTSKVSFSTVPTVAIIALKEDLNQPPVRATLSVAPSSPAGTNTSVGKMMGLGSVCTMTPSFSGTLDVTFEGGLNSNGGNGSTVMFYCGTGTAPSNGAAITGTQVGQGVVIAGSGTSNLSAPFSRRAIITAAKGTAVWFDLALSSTSTANTATVDHLNCNGAEL